MAFTWLALQVLVGVLLPKILALDLPKYAALKTSQHNGTLEITFHNPASNVNTWSQNMQVGMTEIVRRLQGDNQTTVVIFKSDVPRFFLNHLDPAILAVDNAVENFSALMYNISTLPQITIGAVEGRARNAGNELLMALDMRFAVKRDVLLGQFEVGLGTFPGGGGSQQLHRLIGRGLAMEYILTAKDITPKEAERIGWINKAFDSSREMYNHINDITSRLTLFPRGGVLAAKKAINYRANPLRADYEHDVSLFNTLLANPDFPRIINRALVLTNNFTLGEVELNIGRDVVLFYE